VEIQFCTKCEFLVSPYYQMAGFINKRSC